MKYELVWTNTIFQLDIKNKSEFFGFIFHFYMNKKTIYFLFRTNLLSWLEEDKFTDLYTLHCFWVKKAWGLFTLEDSKKLISLENEF